MDARRAQRRWPDSVYWLRNARPISDYTDGRDNNFNLIRMLAAVGVLISHAYPLALGAGTTEPLAPLLAGITLGSVCVQIFFGVSGFLIAQSFERSRSFTRFFWARVLRLFPALIVVLIVTILVAGLFLTTTPAKEFWSAAPKYLAGNLSLYAVQYELPGIFSSNPYGGAINGSLWTLNHEVTCYFGIAAIGMLGVLGSKRRMVAALFVFGVAYAAIAILEPHPRLVALFKLALPFALGTGLYVWRREIPLSLPFGVLLLILAAIAHSTPFFSEMFAVTLVYWVFLAAYRPGGVIRRYNELGDYSYGIYIYAFPIQQLMVAYAGPMTPLQNIALALPVTLTFAVLSWLLIEKPALSLIRKRPFVVANEPSAGLQPASQRTPAG